MKEITPIHAAFDFSHTHLMKKKILLHQMLFILSAGGHKKNIPFRRQRMEIDTTVPDTYTSSSYRVPPPDDPYVADLLQVADTKIAQLEADVARVEDEKDVMDRKLKNFRQQVSGCGAFTVSFPSILLRVKM